MTNCPKCGASPVTGATSATHECGSTMLGVSQIQSDECRISELEQEVKEATFKGYLDGIRQYAWWKDGVQYVGTCGTTLQEALKEKDNES